MHCVRNINAIGGDAVLIQADLLAVEEDVSSLAHAFELEEDAVAGKRGRELEVLAIPGESFVRTHVAATMGDELAEGVDVIEAVGCRDCGPLGVVEGGNFSAGDIFTDELPVVIEVQRRAYGFGRSIWPARGRGSGERWIGPA
jgi:hypothetical protein